MPIEVFVEGIPSPPLWNDAGAIDSQFITQDGVGNGVTGLDDWIDPAAASPGAGGDGTPGIVQFHVDDPFVNLQFPDVITPTVATYGQGLDVTRLVSPPPLGWNGIDDDDAINELPPLGRMVPFFGRQSTSQSDWIPLGLARENQNESPVRFFFGGTDTADGTIEQAGNVVVLQDAVIPGAPLGPLRPHPIWRERTSCRSSWTPRG